MNFFSDTHYIKLLYSLQNYDAYFFVMFSSQIMSAKSWNINVRIVLLLVSLLYVPTYRLIKIKQLTTFASLYYHKRNPKGKYDKLKLKKSR